MTTMPGANSSGYPIQRIGGADTRPPSRTTTASQPPAPGRRAIYLPAEVASYLRAAGVSFKRIEEAEAFFADLYGIGRPFAHRSFWAAGRDVFGRLGDGWIAGTRGGQLALPFEDQQPHPIETHLVFDPTSGRPVSWYPARNIELRPTIQSGQPCISGTSILTAAVNRYARGADTLSLIASKLGLDQSDVEAALDWEHARAYRRGPDTPWLRGRAS